MKHYHYQVSLLLIALLALTVFPALREVQAATPTCVHFDANGNGQNDGYKCDNDDGTFHISYGETVGGDWTPLVVKSDGTRVGPGYISRFINKINGKYMVHDWLKPPDAYEDGELNDPHYGGLLAFGYHAATTDAPGGPKTLEPLFKTSVDNRRDGSNCVDQVTCYGVYQVDHNLWTDGNGNPHVDMTIWFRDDWQAPTLKVTYNYLFEPSNLKVWTSVHTFGTHPYVFVKEPKFVASAPVYNPTPGATQIRGAYRDIVLFDVSSGTIKSRNWYTTSGADYCNSSVNTCQNGFKKDAGTGGKTADYNDCDDTLGAVSCTGGNGTQGKRTRIRYGNSATATQYLNVVARGWNGSATVPWHDSGVGLDLWAEDALNATWMRDENPCRTQHPDGSYHMIRRWEMVNAPKNPNDGNGDDDYRASTLFHAWEGGAGYHDCYGGYRQAQDFAGKVYNNFFSISADVGWTL